jgi:diguanylate cyclase (GGDEF)-like protein
MLATTFNQMADTVENHTRNLEFQILERTHELQSANKLLADLNERLNELAITDGLTGLFNFRQFQDTIRKELVRAKRLRIPFSLLAMDVDFFKQFNDTYGHPSGDIALKKLASVMKERLRESDILCRIGGEEFSAILPGTWHEAAIGLAQELRMSLEKSELINEAGQKIPGITISIGVATFPDHADNVSDLINAADSALYLAKQRGRSQVASAANISKTQG